MSAPQSDAPARSPLSGCLILIIAVLVMVFLVLFSIRVLFKQADAIAAFTDEKPVSVKVDSPATEQTAELDARATAFRTALQNKQSGELLLSADDLNRAIASHEQLKDLKGNFHIDEIAGDHMTITISYKLNGKPRPAREGESGFFVADPRYLNATLTARPALTKGEIVLILDRITPANGKEVADQFRQQMSPYRITERYTTDKTLQPLMSAITGVEIRDNKLVLRRKEGEAAPDVITNEQVNLMSGKFFKVLGVVACGFLVLVGLLLVVALRKKARAEG